MAQSSSEECHGLNCDICLAQGFNKLAFSYCMICDELFCQDCKSVHQVMKLTKNHKLETVKKNEKPIKRHKPSSVSFCNGHNSENVEFYCEDHLVFFCNICKISTHRICKVVSLAEKAQDMKERNHFEATFQTLTSLQTRIERIMSVRKEHADKVKMQAQVCFEELKEVKEKVFEYFQELEDKLTRELNDAEKQLSADIHSHMKVAEVTTQDITSCFEDLKSCTTSGDEEVMAIEHTKMAGRIEGFKNTILDVEEEIQNPIITLNMINIKGLKEQIKSLGIVRYTHSQSLLQLSASEKNDIHVASNKISGSAFIKSGELVLCDGKYCKILRYTKDFKLKYSLTVTSRPWDVAVLGETEVVVTQPDEKKLIFCSLDKSIQVKKKVEVAEKCWGVAVKEPNIFVATHNGYTNGEIIMLNRDGEFQRKIGSHVLKQYPTQAPFYITASAKSDRIYISCYINHTVTCIDNTGKIVFKYKGEIDGTEGMYVDSKDNVLVCGRNANTVFLIRADGKLHKTLLTQADGIIKPYSLTYRASDGALVVGMGNEKVSCSVYMLK